MNNSKGSYIIDNVNELYLNDRKIVLEMIYNSISRCKLNEKGNGTQVNISDLSDILLNNIYTFIQLKLMKNPYLNNS